MKIAEPKVIQRSVAVVLLLLAIVSASDSAWIYLKAHLAQVLIKRAWQQTVDHEVAVKPWAWADTWPVAQLASGRLDVDLYVLNGSHGQALAFGPGYMTRSAMPNQIGTTVIAGHRDTHFSFMKFLQRDEILTLTNAKGRAVDYRVTQLRVVDSRTEKLNFRGGSMDSIDAIKRPHLILVTCYPFDAISVGGPLRYVARAIAIDKSY